MLAEHSTQSRRVSSANRERASQRLSFPAISERICSLRKALLPESRHLTESCFARLETGSSSDKEEHKHAQLTVDSVLQKDFATCVLALNLKSAFLPLKTSPFKRCPGVPDALQAHLVHSHPNFNLRLQSA